MATKTESLPHAQGYLVSEANGDLSRKKMTMLSGAGLVLAGTVLGAVLLASASAQANAGNAGNGAMGAITVGAAAKAGVYKLTIIEPAADAGAFTLEDPDGIAVGNGTVGAAFTGGGLSFTLADGSNNFAAGDGFAITVAAGSGKTVPLDQDGTDGRQHFAGILRDDVDATSADADCVVHYQLCEVNGAELVWPADIEAGEKAAVIAEMAKVNVLVR